MQVYVARLVFQPLVFLPEVAVCLSVFSVPTGMVPGQSGPSWPLVLVCSELWRVLSWGSSEALHTILVAEHLHRNRA